MGRIALYIVAEDDSLVSHFSVPLPIDAFITRFDDLSMDYCSHYVAASEDLEVKMLAIL